MSLAIRPIRIAGTHILRPASAFRVKTLRYHEFGGLEVLRFEEAPIPAPGPGEVLVRVSGAGVNPADRGARAGLLKDMFPFSFPRVEGWEFSGTLERLSADVEGYAEGDRVYGMGYDGTYAEYLVARPGAFAKAPTTLGLPEAGGLPLAGLTAWQGLFEHGSLKAGERVLVLNGSGGVGTLGVQFAKAAGAFVYATGSAARLDLLRDLGVDRPIDYRSERAERVAGDADLVLDLAGGESGRAAYDALASRARFVTAIPPEQGGAAAAYFMHDSPGDLAEIARLVDAGKVRPVVALRPFAEAIEAQRESEAGHVVGKLVVDLR